MQTSPISFASRVKAKEIGDVCTQASTGLSNFTWIVTFKSITEDFSVFYSGFTGRRRR